MQAHVLHISSECYPAAKAGGLGDVVGALPRYLNEAGIHAEVIIPKYHNDWILSRPVDVIFSHGFHMGPEKISYEIHRMRDDTLGFTLYFVHIPGKFDRPGVYSYDDDITRFISFQRAVLEWVIRQIGIPDIMHCHDHQTGLIPFMMQYSPDFLRLTPTPTVFTIHNAAYQGDFGWDLTPYLPAFDPWDGGMIEWEDRVNSLAAAIKCAWRVTTVSQAYMNSLSFFGHGLEPLFRSEQGKSRGIINGIDTALWDPAKDPMIHAHLKHNRIKGFKAGNKKWLCEQIRLDPERPLFVFIGRLRGEKGADFLPHLIGTFLSFNKSANFVILGSGDPEVENAFRGTEATFPENVRSFIEYNEELAHQLYASCDFLLMPSRVEPCGLNQMYCMRYGGIPIARGTGGLIDTIEPLSENAGNGYLFWDFTLDQTLGILTAAVQLYASEATLQKVRKRNMAKDFSWENSAQQYIELYQSLIH